MQSTVEEGSAASLVNYLSAPPSFGPTEPAAAQQQALVRAARQLASQEGCAAFLQQPAAVEALVRRMETSEDEPALDLALLAFRSLVSVADGRAALLQKGPAAMLAIVRCLQLASDSVATAAARAITAVVRPPELHTALQQENPSTVLQSAASWQQQLDSTTAASEAMHGLAAVAAHLEQAGVIEAVFGCLASSNPRTATAAADAVYMLCKQPNFYSSLMQRAELLLPTLAQCLSASSDAVVQKAAACLALQIAAKEQGANAMAQHAGFCRSLEACLDHSSADVVQSVIAVISYLTKVAAGRDMLLQQPRLLASLTQSLGDDSCSELEHYAASFAVDNLSESDAGCSALLQQPDMVAALVRRLSHSNVRLQDAASAHSLRTLLQSAMALARMGLMQEGRRILLQQAGTVAALVGCLEHSYFLAPVAALTAMRGLTMDLEGMWALVQHEGCLSSVVACLAHDHARVRQAASKCLVGIKDYTFRRGRAAVWEAVGQALSTQPSAAQLEVDASVRSLREVLAEQRR